MSIRIYALAKQIQIDSKDLVNLCKELGLDGKESALAGLSEEEVELVKKALQKSPPPKTSDASGIDAGAMRKPSLELPTAKVPVLKPARPPKPPVVEGTPEPPNIGVTLEEARDSFPAVRELPPKNDSPVPPVLEEKSPISPQTVDVVINTSVEQIAKSPIVQTPAIQIPTIQENQLGGPPSISLTPTSRKPSLPGGILPLPGIGKPDIIETDTMGESSPQDDSVLPFVTIESEQVSVPPAGGISTEWANDLVEIPSLPAIPKTKVPTTPSTTPSPTGDASPSSTRPPSKRPGTSRPPSSEHRDPKQHDSRDRDRDKTQRRPPIQVRREEPLHPTSSVSFGDEGDEPLRPVRPSFLDSGSKSVSDEPRRPSVLGRPDDGRIVNLNQPTGTKKKEETDKTKGVRPAIKTGATIHLAPLPKAPPKPVPKVPEVEKAQAPDVRFQSPEELLRASQGKPPIKGPLDSVLQKGREKRGKDGRPILPAPMEKAKDKPLERPKSKKEFIGADIGGDEFSSAKKGAVKKGKSRTEEAADRSSSRKQRIGNVYTPTDETDRPRPSFRHHKSTRSQSGKPASTAAPRKGDIVIEMPCTVKQFAEATGLSAAAVIKKLMEIGMLLNINQPMDLETVELLIAAFDLKAVVKKERTLEEEHVDVVYDQVDPPESLCSRPPVVTFLGHVDHGKTSLLDRILKLDVVSGEKGGITQHIRAYRISTDNGDVTFVDTPGHEAFTAMRARGAMCTDIAVLVVAADDGVMPQTEEAISHAKAANVPIVVALNKIDLPGIKRDRIIQELATNDLMPVEWGGDVEIVETSATTGKGIDELVQTLLVLAELRMLKANPVRPATGIALESSLQTGQGVVCKAIVQNGTLRAGDIVLCGNAYGRVKAMYDPLDGRRHLEEASPSTPVAFTGLNLAPGAGSRFVVLNDISAARQIAEERTRRLHESELADAGGHVTLENLFERISTEKTQQVLNIIIRADVRGSIEAIRKELTKLDHPEVKVKILQASVGGITEADVHLADASDAIIVGFSVVPDEGARLLAEKTKVQVRRYDIIYKLTEDIKAALEGMLKPMEQVKELGRAVVKRIFNISRVGSIAGCRVLAGTLERDCKVRVIRDSRIIGEYVLDTLRREKDDAREVREGYECGIKLKNFNDLKEGDVFEAYKIEEIARTF